MLKETSPDGSPARGSKKTLDDRLGPVGGFIMHYRMMAIPGGFELDRFEIDITPENVGENFGGVPGFGRFAAWRDEQSHTGRDRSYCLGLSRFVWYVSQTKVGLVSRRLLGRRTPTASRHSDWRLAAR